MASSGNKSLVRRLLDQVVHREIDEKMERIPTEVNQFGYDAWGFHPDTARYTSVLGSLLYRRYFRTEVFGIENVPASGRVMLIANHSGQLPLDAVMIAMAMFLEADPPRVVRSMVEYWFPTLPFIGTLFQRVGQFTGLPENALSMLKRDELILVFPEGIRGSGRLFKDRYKLKRFGTGFLRIALEARAPIVPVAVIGGEEQAPSFHDIKPLARLLGFPYFPVTPTFPWLGLLGLIPFPTRYRLHFGEPIIFSDGEPTEDDETLNARIEQIRSRLQGMIDDGLQQRKHIFW